MGKNQFTEEQQEELRQSMPHRQNCLDNAPQEAFFGNVKDEMRINECANITELSVLIDDYMDYYNNDRYQWGLAKLSPNQYAGYIQTGECPFTA